MVETSERIVCVRSPWGVSSQHLPSFLCPLSCNETLRLCLAHYKVLLLPLKQVSLLSVHLDSETKTEDWWQKHGLIERPRSLGPHGRNEHFRILNMLPIQVGWTIMNEAWFLHGFQSKKVWV